MPRAAADRPLHLGAQLLADVLHEDMEGVLLIHVKDLGGGLHADQVGLARALECGYDFVIGVSIEAHKEALLKEDFTLKIVVTGCKR